ncbi:unnamed protein product [Peniophora sp. CBMAI 1063]|nr:unnamed protein product [Peniophora sp. CBMAI 1063]
MARTPNTEQRPLSAKARGKAPMREEEEEEQEQDELDYELDARSESAGSRAGSVKASNAKAPLFTMPETRYPAKFFFYFRRSTKAYRQKLEQLVLDNGAILPFNGRTNKEVWESEKPDIDIFVCDSEERYERAKERFCTSNKTRVYMARQILSWINTRTFNLSLPLIKGMPGRPPGNTYRTNFTYADEELLCKFIAQFCPNPEDGGRQGLVVYNSMMAAHPDWPGALRHTAEAWRSHYKTHRQRLDPIIAERVKATPPREDRFGMDPRQRSGIVPRKGPVIIDIQHEAEESEEDAEEDAEGGLLDMRHISPGAYGDDYAQEYQEEIELEPITPAKRRRSTEGEQGHRGKRRRQETQVEAAPAQKAGSRAVSVAGSDAQNPIMLDDFGPEPGPSQRPKPKPKSKKKVVVELQRSRMRSPKRQPSLPAEGLGASQATLVNSPARRREGPSQRSEEDLANEEFRTAPEQPEVFEPPPPLPRRTSSQASQRAGRPSEEAPSVEQSRHARPLSSPRDERDLGSSDEDDAEVSQDLMEVGEGNYDWLPAVINSPYKDTQDEDYDDLAVTGGGDEYAEEEDQLDDDEAAAETQSRVTHRDTPPVLRRSDQASRRGIPSPDDAQTINKLKGSQRRSTASSRGTRAPVVSASDDEDSDIEARLKLLDNHSRRSSPRYPRLSSLSDRTSVNPKAVFPPANGGPNTRSRRV